MGLQYLTTPPSPHKEAAVAPTLRQEWPAVPAQKGKFYQTRDPQHPKDMLVVMLADTWTDVGTIIEGQKRTMKHQHDAINVLKSSNTALATQLNELQQKHKNLRKAYRRGKYAELSPLVEEPVAPKPTTFL